MVNSKKTNIKGPRAEEFRYDIERFADEILPNDWDWVPSSKKTKVACRKNPLVYYKEFLSRSWFETLKNVLKGSRAERARKQGEILISHRFNAPVPLCWGTAGNHNVTIFEGIEAEPLGDFIYSNWGRKLTRDELKLKRKWIIALASEIGRMHNAGIVHGDLRLNNILINVSKDQTPLFYFLDNERNKQYRHIPDRLIVKNLLQLNLVSPKFISFNDRFRFFHHYNKSTSQFDAEAQKHLIKRIWQLTLKRFARPSLTDCYQDLLAVENKQVVFSVYDCVEELTHKIPKKPHVMHVLLDNSFEWPLFENLINGINSKQFKQSVCYLCGNKNQNSSLADAGITVINSGYTKKQLRRLNFSLLQQLKKEIEDHEIDIVHCQRHKSTVYGTFASIFAQNDVKVITTVHGRSRTGSINRKLLNFLILNRVSKIIAVSNAVKVDIRQSNWLLNSDKIITVYNGIDTSRFDSALSKQDARNKLGLPESKFIFGTAGRLTKVKAHHMLLTAFAMIYKDNKECCLVIAGDGSLKEELELQAESLGITNVTFFTGQRNDIPEVLRALDVFVLPSLSEGHPLVLLEAMAAGLPLIATNVGGIPEILYEPHSARLISPGNVEELVNAMTILYSESESHRESTGKEFRTRVNDRFTIDQMVTKTALLYDEIS